MRAVGTEPTTPKARFSIAALGPIFDLPDGVELCLLKVLSIFTQRPNQDSRRTGWSGAYLFLGCAVPYLGFDVIQHPGFCAAACSLARLLSKQAQASAM
jgi:hypothetical protein